MSSGQRMLEEVQNHLEEAKKKLNSFKFIDH